VKNENSSMTNPRPERPEIPASYGFTASTPHKPPAWNSITERIRTSRNYWICSLSPDGQPHALPVWGVWFEDHLYFVTKRASKKARNLLANPKVAIHLESGDDVISFQGRVEEVSDSTHLAQVAVVYATKYNGDEIYRETEVVFELLPHLAFTWLESNYHQTATRWRFEE
jgi:nitroimidazol reductase NimA-like FMN-containing flavoprotein (pyridoxamine 5'-phosphate oxidase superfamily)